MKLYLKETFDYIPEWNNNRKEVKAEQIVVHFKYLNPVEAGNLKYDDGSIDMKDYFLHVCTGIDNLFNFDKLITPEQFYDSGVLYELRNECTEYYHEVIKVDKKK